MNFLFEKSLYVVDTDQCMIISVFHSVHDKADHN